MKILMLTPYLPHPLYSGGGQIRSYNLIKHLSKHHEITLVCFTRDHNSEKEVDKVRKYCKKIIIFQRGKAWTPLNILKTGFSLYPFLVTIYNSPNIQITLEEELKNNNYDLIHAENFYVMPFLPENNLPTVLVEQTIMSRVFRHHITTEKRWWIKPFLLIDVAKIAYWEKYFWRKANQVVGVSAEDAAIISSEISNKKVKVVPNGVGEAFQKLKNNIHFNKTILYMGNYKWIQNGEAAEILAKEVFPIVRKKIPEAKLIIYGQFINPTIHKLEDIKNGISIVELDDSDQQGVVNAFLNSGLLIAPIYGPGGTRLKILASMAAMVPVVTTTIGSEGYGAIDGKSILVGKTPMEMAEKAIKILNNKKLYLKIANNAKLLVKSNFTWTPITNELELIYKQLIPNGK